MVSDSRCSGEGEVSEEQRAFIQGPSREKLTTVSTFERAHRINIAHDEVLRHPVLDCLTHHSACQAP